MMTPPPPILLLSPSKDAPLSDYAHWRILETLALRVNGNRQSQVGNKWNNNESRHHPRTESSFKSVKNINEVFKHLCKACGQMAQTLAAVMLAQTPPAKKKKPGSPE